MVQISEVEESKENNNGDQGNYEKDNKVPEAKLLGLVSYNYGIMFGVLLTVLGTLWVCVSFEEEDRTRFLTIAAFNLSCLGVTYFSQSTLNKRRQERKEM